MSNVRKGKKQAGNKKSNEGSDFTMKKKEKPEFEKVNEISKNLSCTKIELPVDKEIRTVSEEEAETVQFWEHLATDKDLHNVPQETCKASPVTHKPRIQNTNRCQDNKYKQTNIAQTDPSWNNSSESSNHCSSVRNVNNKQKDKLTFEHFEKNIWKKKIYKQYKHVTEVEADLFSMPEEYSLANCVAEDMNMGSGIAITFRQNFGKIDELLAQKAKQGGLAFLNVNDRFIYYLVTKRESSKKPTLETLFRSMCKLREHMVEHGVTKLAAPTLGCGLDRLEWSDVKDMLEYVFTDSDVMVTICIFQKAEDVMSQSKFNHSSRKCKVIYENNYPITDIESGTLILYTGTENGYVSPQMVQLDLKFNIISDYKRMEKKVGTFECKYWNNYQYALYGCIINKTEQEPFNFQSFKECIFRINKENQKGEKNGTKYYYVAMQEVHDSTDNILMNKIINLLRNTFYKVDIYIFP